MVPRRVLYLIAVTTLIINIVVFGFISFRVEANAKGVEAAAKECKARLEFDKQVIAFSIPDSQRDNPQTQEFLRKFNELVAKSNCNF
jgi:hypothetical protein